MAGKKPVKEFRAFGIKVAIWDNDGTLSVTFNKSYKNREGNWIETNTFFMDDLPMLNLLVQEAYKWIIFNGVKKNDTENQ